MYRAQVPLVEKIMAAQNNPEALLRLGKIYAVSDLELVLFQFPRLRVARLCAWLRTQGRKPDASINNSMLIFNLSADDLRSALNGPLPTTGS